MVCEARRLGGLGPTPADLAFHRRLVTQIKASLKDSRLTLGERLTALIELEHHEQHQHDITTAIYSGQPLPAKEPVLSVLSLSQLTGRARTLPYRELQAPGSLGVILPNRIRNVNAQGVRIR